MCVKDNLMDAFFYLRLTFEDMEKADEENPEKVITVEPHVIPSRGPYLFNAPKK